ncbi:hypothetical protein N431DRAFT_467309 [Stipitochalara longipes BDJ]|nr:hypothetical protein N431DRAFT_467309 [Stipitochalara longipes BDJ]
MAKSLLLAIHIFLFSLISPITALPNVTAIRIGQGDCSAYPNTYSTFGRSADEFSFTPDQADNSSINNSTTGVTDAGLVVYADNTTASDIFCCDHGGTVEDGLGYKALLFSSNATDNKLGYWDQGVLPETYTHQIAGVAQPGVFLGLANVTTWAFKLTSNYYQTRLLGPGQNLSVGEFKGFLKAVLPPNAYLLPPIDS